MSKVQKLRAVVKQRLTAAVDEIFGLFERTIVEYEEEATRSQEKIDRQGKLLDAVRLHRDTLPLDLQQRVSAERQDRGPSLQQEDLSHINEELWTSQEDRELPHIKEEQLELWIREGGELNVLEEPDITKFPFTAVPVKSEYDEEKPRSSQLNQRQTEKNRGAEPLASSSTEQMKIDPDGEECGVSEPAREFYLIYLNPPASNPQPTIDDKTLDSSDTGDSDGESIETSQPQSGLYSEKNSELVGKKQFYCSVCGKGFGYKAHLSTHMVATHRVKTQINCSVCGKMFSHQAQLKLHMIVHTGEKRFNCSVCGKLFGQKGSLNTHMKVFHTGDTPFNCSVCGKGFAHNGKLKTHMIVHTGDKQFKCPICGRAFSLNAKLKAHMITHTEDKPFICSVCGKCFGHKQHLKTHMMVNHTGETQFKCSVCGKCFGNQQHLKTHMMVVHTGGKQFNCSVCGQWFGQRSSLRTHMVIHTEETLKCSVCGKCFGYKKNLKRHMIIHTGEKPYNCSVCGKCFGQKSSLKTHMMSGHTGETQFNCSIGGKGFAHKGKRRRENPHRRVNI